MMEYLSIVWCVSGRIDKSVEFIWLCSAQAIFLRIRMGVLVVLE